MIIFFFYQLDAQILYFSTFITFLNMFRALLCSSSGGQIVLVQSDDTSCCNNTIVLLKISIKVLETCRGMQ